MNRVCPRSSDDIDRTSRGSARLCGKAIVDHLKFLHDFRPKLGTPRTCILVVVVHALDREIVAPRSQPTESQATAGQCRRTTSARGDRRTRNASAKYNT